MKKLKFIFFIFISVLFFLAGCKTLPAEKECHPLDLLDNESAFYLAIPASVDSELVKRMLKNNEPDITDKQCDLLISNIHTVYCGLTHSKNSVTYQISLDSSIPLSVAGKYLTQKNGWRKSEYSLDSSSSYSVYSNKNLDLALLSSKNIVCGRNIDYMIKTFDSDNIKSPLDIFLYNYLIGAEDEIRFYANKPQSFLTILTGSKLDLQLFDVSGSFVQDPKDANQFIVSLDFNFKNSKYRKSGLSLLVLAFGLTNSEYENVDDCELLIKGIHINKNQLYKLLVL